MFQYLSDQGFGSGFFATVASSHPNIIYSFIHLCTVAEDIQALLLNAQKALRQREFIK